MPVQSTCISCVQNITPNNWFSLTRAHVTVGFLTIMDTLSGDSVPPRKPSSSVVKGSIACNSFDCNQYLHYHRFSVLPAISLDGILTVKIVEGSYDSDSFARFIDGLLYHMNPFPGPNSVIIMDNCRIHKSDLVREIIEGR